MQRKKFQHRVRFLLLISCLVGIGFWLLVDSTGSAPIHLQGEITLAYADDSGSFGSRPEIDLQTPETTEIALFALGWFWGVDSQFGSIQGVLRTSAGYAGGSEPNPSYAKMKGYSEAVLVEFNPQETSYQQLLDIFWASHNPFYKVYSRQYRNAIFYLSEEQRIQAEQSREQIQKIKKRPVYTAIEKAGDFYPAEDYHQKYYLRRMDKLLGELKEIYPEDDRFAASTAAARINGYLGCNGKPQDLQQEIGLLGLSTAAQNALVEYVSKKCSRFEGVTCPAPKRE